jgi:acyl dehydratase
MTAAADGSGEPDPVPPADPRLADPRLADPRLAGVIGLRVSSAARTVSAGECGILTSLTWTRGSLHTDITVAERSPFGALSLPGPLIVAIAAGLLASSELMPVLTRVHGIRLTALVGSQVRYLRPVLAGDTVCLDITVAAARASRSRPGHAVLQMSERLVNQRAQCAVEIEEHQLAELLPR